MRIMDQAFRSEELSSSPDISNHLPKLSHMVRQSSRDETIRDYIKGLQRNFHLESEGSTSTSNHHIKIPTNSEQIHKALLDLVFSLLNSSSSETENLLVKTKIQKLESTYKDVMEKFMFKMETFLYSCESLHENMQKTIGKFKTVARVTAGVTLVSSAVELALLIGSSLQKIFHFAGTPKLSSLETFGGNISIGAALLALAYMKWSSADVSRELRQKSNFLKDLVIWHRRGNWIDEEVVSLFPHGINLKLLDASVVNNVMSLKTKKFWRHDLCYAILLTNTQRDARLLKDDKFMTTVKMFVRSQAAEVWWNRRNIKKHLDNILKKVDSTNVKDITADHEAHFKKIALYLYPVMLPLLLNSWNTGRMKFLSSGLLLILSSYDLSANDSNDAEELNKVISNFQKDFTEIKEVCQSLDSEDDY